MRPRTTLIWGKKAPTATARIVSIRGIHYNCPQCGKSVTEPYEGDCKGRPYHYWLTCPHCYKTVDVTFRNGP